MIKTAIFMLRPTSMTTPIGDNFSERDNISESMAAGIGRNLP